MLIKCSAALAVCPWLLCCCAPLRNRDADYSIRPELPAEVFFNNESGEIYVTVRVENGEEGLFSVDTGIPITILDKSFEAKLGKRLGTIRFAYAFRDPTVEGIYASPNLYLGGTQLFTGPYVLTTDLRSQYATPPVLGTLGMNCLRQYCIQLDFADRKLRFLDPDRLNTEDLGMAFPLTIGNVALNRMLNDGAAALTETRLFQGRTIPFWIDTGFHGDVDILLKSKQFQRVLHQQQPDDPGRLRLSGAPPGLRAALLSKVEFGGQTYTNVVIGEIPNETWSFQGRIGSHFLARHLVTFDFPKRVMYLKPTREQ